MTDIIISFEPPTVGQGVPVINQYASAFGINNGVDFLTDPPSLSSNSKIPVGGYAILVTQQAPQGAPGTQVAELWGTGEFGTAAALGKFNSFHRHVGILVGTTSSQGATATLSAYDINGNVVATVSGNVSPGGHGVQLDAVSSSPTPDIVFFVIQGADNGVMLWVTDLSYDPVVSSTPDFRLESVALEVSKGFAVIQGSQHVPIWRVEWSYQPYSRPPTSDWDLRNLRPAFRGRNK